MRLVVSALLVIVLLSLLGFTSPGITNQTERTEAIGAHSFTSSGTEILGWYWLRDSNLSDRAEWVFKNLPEGKGELELEMYVLATDRPGGGRGIDAHFRLLVGYPGQSGMGGVLCPQEVVLENVSSPSDPDGYRCKVTVTVPRKDQCGTTGSQIFVLAERISTSGPHVAFNKDSIVIRIKGWVLAPTALAG